MNRFVLNIAAAATALSFANSAFAGEQFVDETGFAVSGYDVVAYFSLDQNPVGQSQPAPVEGNKAITAEHNGATFAFSSEANRDLFTADPAKYVPQYDGHCAYGVAKGGKVPGNLELSTGNWPSLDPKPASTNTIPQWSSMAPKG